MLDVQVFVTQGMPLMRTCVLGISKFAFLLTCLHMFAGHLLGVG